MKNIDIEKINLAALDKEIGKYENSWVAISEQNRIISSGKTYAEALRGASGDKEVVLLKVPRLDVSLAL